MKTFVAIVVVVVLAAATSGRWLPSDKEGGPGISASARATVARGPLRISVEEDGFLAAKENVSVKPKFKGQGTITWLIEEGKSVVPGDLLVEFDKTQLETQVSELENSLVQYEIELEAAKTDLEIQERDNVAFIEKAEVALQMAELELERYEQGDAPNELRKLGLAAEKASSELDRAKEQYEQVPELVSQGFLTRIQGEEERIVVREAEINEENARRELELHETYTRCIERTKKESTVKDAARELENARQKGDSNLKGKQAALAQREQRVSSSKSRLEQQRTELGYYTVKAETAGIVHYGDPEESWWGEDIKVGSTTYQGRTIITIPDLSEMQVLIQVHEADIDKVKLEQPVVITVDSRKGETFTGKITDIATVASATNWADEANKSFKVKVTLDSTPTDLRAGVTAKAEIEIETLADVLHAPIHAVVPEAGKHLAFVIHGEEIEERAVKIGKNNAHFVQILEGLVEGDEVLLYDPRVEGAANAAGERAEQSEAPAETALPAAVAE